MYYSGIDYYNIALFGFKEVAVKVELQASLEHVYELYCLVPVKMRGARRALQRKNRVFRKMDYRILIGYHIFFSRFVRSSDLSYDIII